MPKFIRKNIHLKDFEYKSGYLYFITMCCANKEEHFLNSGIAKIIEEELERRKTLNEISLYCYCLMPDHLHILMTLTEFYDKTLQNWVSSFKRFTSREIKEKFRVDRLWHKNFYEHIVGEDESMKNIAEYILHNPVRKNLVKEW